MSEIKVDALSTVSGSGNLTVDTDTLVVDSTNNTVGIRNTSSSALQSVNGRPGLVVGDTSGARGIAILTSATGAGTLLFANATSGAGTYRGYIEYDHNGNTLNTYINSSVHAQRIHSDGVISIPQGIELGSGVDKTAANTLDDYEEGSWTPVWSQGVSSPGYLVQQGRYTKVGNRVTLSCYLRSNSGSANASHVYIGGLPFVSTNSITAADGAYNTYLGGFYNNNNGAQWLVINNSNIVALYRQTDGAALGGTSAGVSVHADVRVVISYQTDA